jgi:hypothetical protein
MNERIAWPDSMLSFTEPSKEKSENPMKWLEVVELRTAGSNRELLESQLQTLIDAIEKATPQQAIKSYRRVMISNDFSIHLYHESTKVENKGSQLGLRLASALKEFGLVNHSIWFEMHGK